jgi:hypothetical protein
VTRIAVLAFALLALPATTAEAQPSPVAEQVQAWATTMPRQPTSLLDPVFTPIEVIHELDRLYAVMVEDFSQKRPGDAWGQGSAGSKVVDRYRRVLVHSPDKSLNKLINKALDQVGDVFDEVDRADTEAAADRAPRSNLLWAQVEITLKQYGVDTGAPWSISMAK